MIEINKIKDIILKQKTVILIPIFILGFIILKLRWKNFKIRN